MKGILMKTWEVRAILDNRKTVMWRVVKPQPVSKSQIIVAQKDNGTWFWWNGGVKKNEMKPPYIPGDILYVRETWQYAYDVDECDQIIEETGRFLYAADGDSEPFNFWLNPDGTHRDRMPWRPSIHMPREAARIFLRVTDVRVEKLHDIEYFGCLNEGIPYQQFEDDIIKDFADVRNSTIKPKDRALYGWEANPWGWVIEFERISKEEATK